MRENGFKCLLFEAESQVGGTFRYRAYENAELVSSKQLTAFSDFRFPPEQGDHVSLPQFCAYLERYADHFALWRDIRLESRVVAVKRAAGEGNGHVVEVQKRGADGACSRRTCIAAWLELIVRPPHAGTTKYACKYLTICTGLHVVPQVPALPGVEHVSGNPHKEVLHSSQYKERKQLKGKRVLILGTGETGMDLAYESVKAGAEEVVLCSRGGFLSFPKVRCPEPLALRSRPLTVSLPVSVVSSQVLNNFRVFGTTFDGHLPIDGLITNLFESA